jgi:hypothetical protein
MSRTLNYGASEAIHLTAQNVDEPLSATQARAQARTFPSVRDWRNGAFISQGAWTSVPSAENVAVTHD